MKSIVGQLAAIALMSSMFETNAGYGAEGKNPTTPKDINPNSKQVIPKGCKEYWFNEKGYFSTEGMRYDEIVFKCIASNGKVAKNKFEKWLKSQSK